MNTMWHKLRSRIAYALYAGGFVPLTPTGNAPIIEGIYRTGNLADFFTTLFTTAISIGAIAAVLRLAYAGYMYMVSDMWTSKEHARGIIRDVFLGLLLLLAIWLILFQINPDILKLDILSGLKQKT
jgi:hypothetical protein